MLAMCVCGGVGGLSVAGGGNGGVVSKGKTSPIILRCYFPFSSHSLTSVKNTGFH